MHERVGVDELDRRGDGVDARDRDAESLGGGVDQQGAHALAALEHRVAHRLVQADRVGAGGGEAAVERAPARGARPLGRNTAALEGQRA
ncbi:hypothetical protein D3C83_76320 [compost metagenome]